MLAPIALFVYNRPVHTRKTLSALEANSLAEQSDIYIFSDGAKTAQDIEAVNQVRSIIREPWKFKHIYIIERSQNKGLANSIIEGVTQVVQKHGRIIVLEDDLETSSFALQYFNDALNHYQDQEKVMEISGYMYPVEKPKKLPQSFFFRVANSWGWATWDRAWQHFNPDIEELTKDFTRKKRKAFSVDNSENFWKQVKQFKAGKINSWAIRWYLSVFNKGGLVLYPRFSFIQNTGTDGSGTHSDVDKVYRVELSKKPVRKFPVIIEEDPLAFQAIKHFYKNRKGTFFERLAKFIEKKMLERKMRKL
ncbi:sugar transferase [Sphingobacterium sp.]|uniref:sugar transferase n=1 Tax=Sphingobacterium sp. TaxID=341027 RepID=UPI0028B158BC|nr:sugar transferase [Sphingobacterium sp.]